MYKEVYSVILNSPLFPENEKDQWISSVGAFDDEQLLAFVKIVSEYEKNIKAINELYKQKKSSLNEKHIAEWRELVEKERRRSLSILREAAKKRDEKSLEEIRSKIFGT